MHFEGLASAFNHRGQHGGQIGKSKGEEGVREGGQELGTAQGMPGMPLSWCASCLGLFLVGL